MEVPVYETESPRLVYRRLRANDYALISRILQDEQTMYSWEHAFTYDEICEWLADNMHRYHTDGCGCWAALKRDTEDLIALTGPIMSVPAKGADPCPSLLYIVRRDQWLKGYGTECAQAVIDYAFDHMDAPRVSAVIRTSNIPALRVAATCGMRPVQQLKTTYLGKPVSMVLCILTKENRPPKREERKKSSEAVNPPSIATPRAPGARSY